MKYLFSSFLLLYFIVIQNGCGQVSGEQSSKLSAGRQHNKTKKEEPVCLVFCDFTTSIDTINSDVKIKNDAIELFTKLSDTHIMYFYALDENALSAPFFFYGDTIKRFQSITDIARAKQKKKAIDALFKKTIEAKSSQKHVEKSCIISNIERAIRELKNIDPEGQQPDKIFFLSDMLEFCNGSFGHINLEDKEYERDLKKVNQSGDPSLSFSVFKEIKIMPVLSTDKINDVNKLKLFWTTVFKKYGYRGVLPEFSPLIPWDFMNK